MYSKSIDWKQAYIFPFSATSGIVLRSFQFKILHRILPTNKHLFTCKLKNSNLCDFCSSSIETIEHIFWECPITQDMGSQLVTFFNNRCILITLYIMDVYIGTDQYWNTDSIINVVLLLMTCFINTAKLSETIQIPICFR